MATADLARTRFGSGIRRLRHANLVHLSRKTARKIAAPLARIKTDLILCTESPKKSELTDSADRSIARRADSSRVHHRDDRHVGLDKMCLLIEVRRRCRLSLISLKP